MALPLNFPMDPCPSRDLLSFFQRATNLAGWIVAVFATLVVVIQVWSYAVNVPFIDEFDYGLEFPLRWEQTSGVWAKATLLTSFHNEHRTAFGRSLLLLWLWYSDGVVNFRILTLAAAGWLPLLAWCLIRACRPIEERTVLFWGSLLLVFNLQHYESLFWAGSSMDHFPVYVFAMVSLFFLTKVGPSNLWTWAGAGSMALLAALTLAQGLVVFPAGVLLLLLLQKFREALVWACFGALVVFVWMHGYQGHVEHPWVGWSPGGLLRWVLYSFGLIGSAFALGSRSFAMVLGAVFFALTLLVLWLSRGKASRLQAILLLAWGCSFLIGMGRAGLDAGQFMASRYTLLSVLLAGALFPCLWSLLAPNTRFRRGIVLSWSLLLLVFAGNNLQSHWHRGPQWATQRMAAISHFQETGTLAGSPFMLYWSVERGDALLHVALERGLYQYPVTLVVKPSENFGEN